MKIRLDGILKQKRFMEIYWMSQKYEFICTGLQQFGGTLFTFVP